jgi:hypothetical protein
MLFNWLKLLQVSALQYMRFAIKPILAKGDVLPWRSVLIIILFLKKWLFNGRTHIRVDVPPCDIY